MNIDFAFFFINEYLFNLLVEEIEEEIKPEETSGLAPEFLEKPKFQTVNEGETVVFKAEVEATPQPEVIILIFC